jgi:hypothetical protein
MSEELIEITGIEECCRMLSAAPKAAIPGALLHGLSAAGAVIEEAIDIRVPVKAGELKTDLDMTVTLDSDFRGGVVAVGFGAEGYKARWVEYGHHQIGHRPGKKDLGEVEPHPFMRPAADTCAESAIDAFVDAVMKDLAAAEVIDAAA